MFALAVSARGAELAASALGGGATVWGRTLHWAAWQRRRSRVRACIRSQLKFDGLDAET